MKIHHTVNSVFYLGMGMMACHTLSIPLPATAKKFFKDVGRDTPLDEIDEDEVWIAVADMIRLIDARHKEGYSAKTMHMPPHIIERIAQAKQTKAAPTSH